MIDSFILYTRYKNNIKSLSREQKGYLLELIFDYEESDHQTEPDIDDGLVAMAFSFIKNDLDNNLERYQKAVNSGKKGGRPKQANPLEQENLKVNDPFLDKNLKVSDDKTISQDPFNDENLNDNEYEYDNEYENELLKKKNKKEKDFSFESVCDGELLNSLKEFEKMRKSIKKPLTPRARSMLWNKLNKMSSDLNTQIAIVNQSIFHNWQDVYELKDNSKEVPNYDDAQTDNRLAISDEEYAKFLKGVS